MAHFEGVWDCGHCGTTNKARHRACQSCGVSISSTVRFRLPTDAKPLSDPKLIAEATAGAAWHCDHCDTMNPNMIARGQVTSCLTCGNVRDEHDRNRLVKDLPAGARSTTGAILEGEDRSGKREHVRLSAAPAKNIPKLIWPSLLIAAVLVVILAISSIFVPIGTSEMRVEHRHWERTIEIEAYRTLQKSGWSHPSDARVHTRVWKYKKNRTIVTGTQSYACGTTSNGNGYYSTKYCTRNTTRQEKVYDWHYTYEVDRWVVARVPRAADIDTEPYWPKVSPKGPKERLGDRWEDYKIEIKNGDDVAFVSLPYAQWAQMNVGDMRNFRTNIWGTPLSLGKDENSPL